MFPPIKEKVDNKKAIAQEIIDVLDNGSHDYEDDFEFEQQRSKKDQDTMDSNDQKKEIVGPCDDNINYGGVMAGGSNDKTQQSLDQSHLNSSFADCNNMSIDNLLPNEYEQHLELDNSYRKRLRDRNDSQLLANIKINRTGKQTLDAYQGITQEQDQQVKTLQQDQLKVEEDQIDS